MSDASPAEPAEILAAAERCRTFAIISHPDAGKTTLTEKLLLYAGAIQQAGNVRERRSGRTTTSDWMEMEQRRGISVSSTVLRFAYRDHHINLLDTPGHRDFSEDTYRVLSATDAAVMVIDAAKGVEAQTLKLFEVARERGLPLLTFVNKCDRPGPGPLAILDEIEQRIGLPGVPVTWPVGMGTDFVGVVDRRDHSLTRFERSERGAKAATEDLVKGYESLLETELAGPYGADAHDELLLLEEATGDVDVEAFLAGIQTPVFFGSALWNFGIRHLLDAVIDLAPSPRPAHSVDGDGRRLEAPFAGFVFKIQANTDRNHRDHVAFLRACSGRFQRGMTLTHGPTGRPVGTKHALAMFGQDRDTIDDAWPGDVIGLVNASELRIGDTLYEAEPVVFPPIPTFAPELFMTARNRDTAKYKQFAKGLSQLDREGVVQVLRDPSVGNQAPVLAAVGQLQFEVAKERLETEFGAPVELSASRYRQARQTDAESAAVLRTMRNIDVLEKEDGSLFALFASDFVLANVLEDHPELTLREIVVA